ncbi:potassium transporter TrkA [Streptococcus sp. NPS 308]|uniref:potassium transporter TrkA n=1 Tax=Streptococcus sp. NPS 308 TaxID=1902136 RepID=UPI0012FE75A4|nr:potassium transporter TrkA [Streptococcus sp. NPS 308]
MNFITPLSGKGYTLRNNMNIHTLKETGLSEVIRQIIEEEILEFLPASTFKVSAVFKISPSI